MKKYQITLIVCCILFIHAVPASSQSVHNPAASPYSGLTAYSTLQEDPLSFTANQAALAFAAHAGLGLYGEQRYMLNGLNTYALSAALPAHFGNFGLSVLYSGFKNFNEMQAGFAYARKLAAGVALGLQFNYYSYQIPGYYKTSTLTAEGGIIITFAEKFHGGCHIYNPLPAVLPNTEGEKLATRITTALGYDISDQFYTVIELIKEENKTVTAVAGFQYHFSKRFFVRAGLTAAVSSPFVGAGLYWNHLRIDVAASYHPQLGVCPATMILADFQKNRD